MVSGTGSIDPIPYMIYHVFVALRRNKRKSKSQTAVVFWLAFIVVIAGIFLVNKENIQKNFNLFKARISGRELSSSLGTENELPADELAVERPAVTIQEPAAPALSGTTPAPKPQPQAASEKPAPTGTTPAGTAPPVQQKPAETRDRNIYFTQIDKDGQILRSRVNRKVPVSGSPMQDALNVMLIGPTADELNKGMISLIPQNTRILSATVRGNTAYISFSEDFQFNTHGVEGYAAQLRQVVWTVTEFQNIKDVQILIEGKRVDYLGEGIFIGSPISRDSF